MNWKFEAMEKLREYEARKQSLATIPDEIRRLELDYTRIRNATGKSWSSRPLPRCCGSRKKWTDKVNEIC